MYGEHIHFSVIFIISFSLSVYYITCKIILNNLWHACKRGILPPKPQDWASSRIWFIRIWKSSCYLYFPSFVIFTHPKLFPLPLKGPITRGWLARLAGLARFAGISARLWNILKINFAITWKNLSPASWDPSISARRTENLPCNRNWRANTFSSLNFASEQNGSPEGRYFCSYITHRGLSDHKAT